MMYLNLHIVGGTATFAESGRSHQSARVGKEPWVLTSVSKTTSHNCLPHGENIETVDRQIKTLFGGSVLLCPGRLDPWFRIHFWVKGCIWLCGSYFHGGCDGPRFWSQNRATQRTMWQVNWQSPRCLQPHMPGLGEVIKDMWAQVWHLTSSHNMHFQN